MPFCCLRLWARLYRNSLMPNVLQLASHPPFLPPPECHHAIRNPQSTSRTSQFAFGVSHPLHNLKGDERGAISSSAALLFPLGARIPLTALRPYGSIEAITSIL